MIGVGNPWRRDDGAGPAVARNVGGESTIDPSQLLDLWAGAAWAIVVDAASFGDPVGTVRYFDVTNGPLPTAGAERRCKRRFGVGAAIELARALGRLPRRIEVVTVEGEDFGEQTGLTPAVALAVTKLSRELEAAFPRPEADAASPLLVRPLEA